MSHLFFHPGSSPDLFLIACAVISVVSVLILRARKKRNSEAKGAQE